MYCYYFEQEFMANANYTDRLWESCLLDVMKTGKVSS
jgi:hypothetical protein